MGFKSPPVLRNPLLSDAFLDTSLDTSDPAMAARREHPAGVLFQKKIEQTENRRREKLKAEQKRMINDEVKPLFWTSESMEDTTSEKAKQLYGLPDKTHELDARESTIQGSPLRSSQSPPSPLSRPWVPPGSQSPQSPQSSHPGSSCIYELGDVEKQEDDDGNERVQKLETDLKSARTDIRTLQQTAERANLDIKALREERDATGREIAQAHLSRSSEDSDTERLEERNQRLVEQIERLIRDRNHAEDQIDEGRARELQLSRDLRAAKQESKQVTELANERKKVWEDNDHRPRSRRKDSKTLRKVSSRRTGPSTVEKTVIDFTIKDDGGREAGCGCLIM
ncbi:hypothetical protein MMC17_006219 [Xylographa soralifera]|nr:hypothetical protein [Xylographa soralifera]